MTRTAILAAALMLCGYASGAEVTTNGVGGGPWSDGATWKGGKAPAADDDVVIRKGDVVTFDRNDDGKVTCQKLFIDPKGGMKFKTGAGKIVFCCAAGIESYGPITLDGSKAATDFLELRFVGPEPANRTAKFLKGSALTTRGKQGLPKDGRNVMISSPPFADPKKDPIPATVTVSEGGTTVDLQHAEFASVKFVVTNIDSTGAKVGEKLTVIGNKFTGFGRFAASTCDTATIIGNSFGHPDLKRREGQAIYVYDSPLSEVKDNVVTGGFDHGIFVTHAPDYVVSGNTVENCGHGVYSGFGTGNAIARNTVRSCDLAYVLYYTHRVIMEDNLAEGAKHAVSTAHATAQITTLRIAKPSTKDAALHVISDANSKGQIVLLNCGLKAADVKLELGEARKEGTPHPVVTMEYLVVSVKNAPADAEIEVRATGEKDVTVVRNSPAPLTKGLTPLPQPPGTPITVAPLIVRSWSLDADGKVDLSPLYSVRVVGPPEKPGAERKVLAFMSATPSEKWYRPKVDDPAPTLEVTVK
jgi:parallel beta-helix repeat protein